MVLVGTKWVTGSACMSKPWPMSTCTQLSSANSSAAPCLKKRPDERNRSNRSFEAVGHVHRAHMIPEGIAGAPRDLVVCDDEVADIFKFEARLAVVFVDVRLRKTDRREHRQQPVNAGLDQVDAGRIPAARGSPMRGRWR